MARIQPLAEDDLDPLTAACFDGARALLGRVPNAGRTKARLPYIYAWLLPFTASLQREGAGGRLDGRTKELVVLATSVTNACEYCVTHNRALGAATGLTQEQIDAVENGYATSPALSDRDKAVVRWAEAVTLNEAARDNGAFEALKQWFDDDEILEITMLAGLFNMTNKVHEALQLDIEPPDEVALIKRSAHVSRRAIRDYVRRILDVMDAEDDQEEVTAAAASEP